MDTDALISRMAENSDPVECLPRPWIRAALWFAVGLPTLVLVVAIHGLDVSPGEFFSDRRLMLEEIATLATAFLAAVAAFSSTVPGASRKWLWLPLVPFAVWLLSVGEGCLSDWQKSGWDSLGLRIDTTCFLPMVVTSIVPAIAMVRMLRRGAPLSPRLTLILGMLATAALVNSGLRLFHVGDITVMVLVWHMGLMALLSIAAGCFAPSFLDWKHNFARLPASVRAD